MQVQGWKCQLLFVFFSWIVRFVIFQTPHKYDWELIFNLEFRSPCVCMNINHCAHSVLSLCQQRFESKGNAAANQNMEPLKRMSPPLDTDTGVGMQRDADNLRICVRSYQTTCRILLSIVVVGPRTCSIVRLQARIRVQSAHHKIVGEAARSRSGGRSAAAHLLGGAGVLCVRGRFTAAGLRGGSSLSRSSP